MAEDDVWICSVSGGRAWRLSVDRVRVSRPRLDPDAAMVAWTTWRDGAPEVYLAATAGGPSRRLTYWGDATTEVRGWTVDRQVLAISAHGQPFSHHTWAYGVPVDGGQPVRLPYGPVGDLAVSADAAALLTAVTSRDPAHWKRYRGGAAGQLWVQQAELSAAAGGGAPFARILPDLSGHFASPLLLGDGRLAFLSDHEGVGNLYSCRLDGSDLRRHTDHAGFYARNASTDGQRIVYQCAGQIWLLDRLEGASRPVDITLGSASAGRQPFLVDAEEHLDDLSCDHTGRASAVEVRGTVHWLTHRDGPVRALAVSQTACARLPRVLGRTGDVAWIADADGEDALEIASVSAASPAIGQDAIARPPRLAAGRLGLVADLCAAPDGRSAAVAARDGRLHLVDIVSGDTAELAMSDAGPVSGLAYSPDSAWLAWSQPGPLPLRRIRLARLADRSVVDVTDGRFMDTDPAFTTDGEYLAFLSRRSFDPVYDAHFFDLSFPYGCRPYLVPLAAATPSPFAPLLGGRPVDSCTGKDGGDGPGEDSADGGGADAEGRDVPPRPVTVDLEGLAERVVAVPVAESRYFSLRGVKDGLVWLKEPLSGTLGEGGADIDTEPEQPSLERFDLKRRKCEQLAEAVHWFEVSGDGNRLAVRDDSGLRVIPSRQKVDADDSDARLLVDLSRVRVMADPAAAWRHALDEAARITRHDFWVADMAGVDWDAIVRAYSPLLDRLGGRDDFADLLWEVLGELGTSHAYVIPPPQHASSGGGVGLLGADLERDSSGRWRVVRVLPGESSDPRARSPLATPGAAIRPGDELIAIDGHPVASATGPAPLLVGAAGKPVELTVHPAQGGPIRRVVVVPLEDEQRLRYQDWVARRRAHVHEVSAGRVGYLHAPDMMGVGWAQFHRDLRVEMAEDALVVDVRGNRGGHVSQLMVEKLARRIIGWSVPRGLPPETYPCDAPHGPIVVVADQHSGSDGDIITAAIRILGLGTVVGTRTWGGVIGIDSRHYLVDGTRITVPRHAMWLDSYGWDVENRGVEPDIEVVMSPDDWARGADPQLDRAIEVAMAALAAKPPVRPPTGTPRPARGRPALPARVPPPDAADSRP